MFRFFSRNGHSQPVVGIDPAVFARVKAERDAYEVALDKIFLHLMREDDPGLQQLGFWDLTDAVCNRLELAREWGMWA